MLMYKNVDLNAVSSKENDLQFFAYKMTVSSENSMLKHRNVDLNTGSLKASDCTRDYLTHRNTFF
jgi:hypothetical protein